MSGTSDTHDEGLVLLEDDDDFDLEPSVTISHCNTLKKAKTIPLKKGISGETKKNNAWINPSFSDFCDLGNGNSITCSQIKSSKSEPTSRKRTRDVNEPPRGSNHSSKLSHENDDLWVDKYKPNSLADLAVHKKKIGEVQEWLEINLNQRNKYAPMLLLTGAAGSGKSATIHALGEHMHIDIKEWSNPVLESKQSMNPDRYNGPEFVPVGGSAYESQGGQFTDFLLRANRYPSLQMLNLHALQSKLILVEEYPNVFFSQTGQFHDILRRYRQQGQSPIVFIVSDSAAGDGNERLLFPKEIQADLLITNISFNPVAPTSLSKVLQKIASSEASQSGRRVRLPNKSQIDELVSSCSGDIRGAINALQFTCRTGNQVKSSTPWASGVRGTNRTVKPSKSLSSKGISSGTKKGKQTGGSGQGDKLAAIGARDTSLFLFRALGKILYCKREAEDIDDPKLKPPDHLSHHHRLPLQFDPEDVIEKSQVSGEFFISYLHQNYLDFFPELEDVTRATDYLSDADHLTTNWTSRQTLRSYAASVAARGLIHSNSSKSGIGGTTSTTNSWKPLHKPQWFAVNKQMRENIRATKSLFRDWHSTPEELQTQVLPFMAKTRTRPTKPGQGRMLQDITRFAASKQPRGAERLDEKDLADLTKDEDESQLPVPNAEEHTAAIEDLKMEGEEVDEEEILIEDFDD